MNAKASSLWVACGFLAATTSLRAITDGPPVPGQKRTPPATTVAAVPGDAVNPYAVITDRNIFRLTSPPPPKAPEEKPVELPKVYLGGLMKIGDDIRVLFSIPAKDAKTPASYLKLSLGERQNGVELLKIHPDQQGVDIRVNDTPMTLTMKSNSLAGIAPQGAPAAAPVAAAAPAAPGGGSALVIGKHAASKYGSVAVAGGGGGVTDIGGNNVAPSVDSPRSGGVSVAGGGYSGYNGGGAVSAANNPSAQLANTLTGATANNVPVTPPPTQIVPPAQQGPLMAAHSLADSTLPPLPPNILNQLNGGGDEDPPLPTLPGQKH